jgi:glutamyl/glutaminyl-tRNA synthetase
MKLKMKNHTIILVLLLLFSLITLLSYFFFTKYKFLINYIDDRIDIKNAKLIEKFNLEDESKSKEHIYLNNLKTNLKKFNEKLSNTNFIDQINEYSEEEQLENNDIEDEQLEKQLLVLKDDEDEQFLKNMCPSIDQYNISNPLSDIEEESYEEESNGDEENENSDIEENENSDIEENENSDIEENENSDIKDEQLIEFNDEEFPNLENLTEQKVDDYINQILDDTDQEFDLSNIIIKKKN